MTWFITGLIAGILLTTPLIYVVSRRTERKVRRLEKRARSAERLAEIGTLTAGLAHEIKNPLSTIGLNLQLLREALSDADFPPEIAARLSKRIHTLSGETERLGDILEDFLSFAGRVRVSAQPTDVNELIEQLVDFYLPQAEASGVRFRTQLSPDTGSLKLDKTLFKQALLNLLINATQAMVEARYESGAHGGAEDLILRTTRTPEGIEIHVTDTGPGIAPETLEKVFHPYFSTKRGGTGLGLAMTRRIINEHNGTIDIHTDPGQGSDFIIMLPHNTTESITTTETDSDKPA